MLSRQKPSDKTSVMRAVDWGPQPALPVFCFQLSCAGDFPTDTPVAALPGAWPYRISAGTGWTGVSLLCLGEISSLMCTFSVRQHIHLSEQIRP